MREVWEEIRETVSAIGGDRRGRRADHNSNKYNRWKSLVRQGFVWKLLTQGLEVLSSKSFQGTPDPAASPSDLSDLQILPGVRHML